MTDYQAKDQELFHLIESQSSFLQFQSIKLCNNKVALEYLRIHITTDEERCKYLTQPLGVCHIKTTAYYLASSVGIFH